MGFFQWQTGLYGQLAESDTSTLPPNIAIVCYTPVVSGSRGPHEPMSEAQASEMCDPLNRVCVLNVIGYAFDSDHQPDQMYFLAGNGSRIASEKRRDLVERFG